MLLELVSRALFDASAARALPMLLLVLLRTAGLCLVAPWLGYRAAPGATRVAVAAALAIVFTPLALAAAPELPSGLGALTLMGVRELLIGVAFAIAVSAPLYALEWTGQLIDRGRGGVASGRSGNPLAQLHLFAGLVVFVLLGGHRLALAAFGQTLLDAPPGLAIGAPGLMEFALGAARIAADALVLALAFAAPAALAFVLLELTLGLGARVAPAVGAWIGAMPLRAGLGLALALLTLAALLPRLGPTFDESVRRGADLVSPARP